jgi:DnaK suppressor protein
MTTLRLTEDKIFEIQQKLFERRQELRVLEELGDEASKTVELDQSRVGRLTRMDALQGQAMSQELKRRRDMELSRIVSALQRIDDSEYGYCIECGEEISAGRLEYDPAVASCIDCASKRD